MPEGMCVGGACMAMGGACMVGGMPGGCSCPEGACLGGMHVWGACMARGRACHACPRA